MIRKRNILFTAITRSKAWVRVVGIGDKMNKLIEEYESVKENNFELNFIYPSKEEIDRMNLIHRDISKDEENIIKKDIESLFGIQEIIERIESKESFIEDYPEKVRLIIKKMLK